MGNEEVFDNAFAYARGKSFKGLKRRFLNRLVIVRNLINQFFPVKDLPYLDNNLL